MCPIHRRVQERAWYVVGYGGELRCPFIVLVPANIRDHFI